MLFRSENAFYRGQQVVVVVFFEVPNDGNTRAAGAFVEKGRARFLLQGIELGQAVGDHFFVGRHDGFASRQGARHDGDCRLRVVDDCPQHSDLRVLVQDQLGAEAVKELDWSAPRLVCVASDFTRYDEHAILQMGRSIELVRYRDFQGEFLALDLVASTAGNSNPAQPTELPAKLGKAKHSYATVTELLPKAPEPLATLYADLDVYLMALGDDVTMTTRKLYFAYRRIKNFACVEVHPNTGELLVFIKVDPQAIRLEEGFSRDVSNIGHFGTGDVELHLKTGADFEKAQPLLHMSYENS